MRIVDSALSQVRGAAERTPARRERHVDLVRAVAIAAVVLGHWLVAAVTEANGRVDGLNALAVLRWTHPLTWLFQVMPLFFFVGGYANAASLASHRQAGGDALGWTISRYNRLLRPTSALLAVLALAVLLASLAGVDREFAATAAWVATIPLWFVTAYLAVLALAPWAYALHRRWGWLVPILLAALVGVGDLARLGLGMPWLADMNYLLGWLAIHQVGFAWRDGRLPARPSVGLPLAAGGLLALVALTLLGPYPVSMVRVPDTELHNTSPPTLALLALAVTQIGVTVSLRDRASAWLRRDRPWTAVVGVNAVIMTVFLWHMAAVTLASLLLYASGVLPVVPLDSARWLVLRIPWMAVCALLLIVLVAAFARVELATPRAVPGATVGHGVAFWSTLAGMALAVVGMIGVAGAGPGDHGPFGLPTAALLAYGAGATLVARRVRDRDRRPRRRWGRGRRTRRD